MENDKIYLKLKYLFNDKSMPSMVLLNGKWGSGKSYYLNKKLIPLLEKQEKKVVAFSLYGISDIEDFRDKLISAYLLKNKSTAGILDKFTQSIISATGFSNSDNSSALISIFNGLKGVAKHSILTKIGDFILILDDLERIGNPSLINDILGECLQLAENNDVQVLVAANIESISEFGKILDKCMSDTINFSLSYDEVFAITFGQLNSSVVKNCKPKILETIKTLEIRNLRILKRCANRIDTLLTHIEKSRPDVDIELSANHLTPQVISIINAFYKLEIPCSAIKDNISNSISGLLMPGSEVEITPEQQKIKAALELAAYATDDIIEFSCGEIFSAEEISDFGNLPLKSSLLDKLILGGPSYLSEAETISACKELEEYLTSEEADCHRWFSCLDSLDYLIAKKYISQPKFLGNSVIEFAKQQSEIIKFSQLATKHSRRARLLNSEIETVMKNTITNLRNEIIRIRFTEFKALMLSSWSKVDMDVYKNYSHECFINVVGSKFIIECIRNWKHKDIALFKNFIEERYGFQNIGDYFRDELNDIQNLNKYLSELMSKSKPSLKTGAIVELNIQLKDVEERLIIHAEEA